MIPKRPTLSFLLGLAGVVLLPSCADEKPEPLHPVPIPPLPAAPLIPVASEAPGRPGYVISPYTGQLVDIADCAPGGYAKDPTTSKEQAEMKIFRVPGVAAQEQKPVE